MSDNLKITLCQVSVPINKYHLLEAIHLTAPEEFWLTHFSPTVMVPWEETFILTWMKTGAHSHLKVHTQRSHIMCHFWRSLSMKLDIAWASQILPSYTRGLMSKLICIILSGRISDYWIISGLAHSPSRDSVMFPYYQGYNDEGTENNVQLGYDDIIAMYQLYSTI